MSLAPRESSASSAHGPESGRSTLWLYGGVPERPNGSVLKTDDRRKAVRGFKSHPRRY